jgi:hypothetical protein
MALEIGTVGNELVCRIMGSATADVGKEAGINSSQVSNYD